MSGEERSERLVQVHHARNEWEGNLVVGYLRDNGIEAMLRSPPTVTLFVTESPGGEDKANGVFVLEHAAERARDILKDFLPAGGQAADADETDLQH